jgi:hypothetical protein
MCPTMALPFTLNNILRKNNYYGNFNISPCKNIILKKRSIKKNQNHLIYYNFNQSQVSIQAKISSFKNSYIKIHLLLGGQNPLS